MEKVCPFVSFMKDSDKEKQHRDNRSIGRMLTLVMQFGISMVVPIGMCFFLGYLLDKWLGTSFFIIVFFFLGALGGFRSVYIFASKMQSANDRDKTSGQLEDEEILKKMKASDSATDERIYKK